jgi:hypothetical protein
MLSFSLAPALSFSLAAYYCRTSVHIQPYGSVDIKDAAYMTQWLVMIESTKHHVLFDVH